jgi:hypothetical protein
MLTLFMLLAAAGGILRLALARLLKQRWGVYWRPSSLSRCPCSAGRTA